MSHLYMHPVKDSYDCIEKLKVLFPRLLHYKDLKWMKAAGSSMCCQKLSGIDPDHRLSYATNPTILTGQPWKELKGKELILRHDNDCYVIEAVDAKSRW